MSKLQDIRHRINTYAKDFDRGEYVELLAVTKNQSADSIQMLLKEGHKLFGENRVQEAYLKWPALKQSYPNVQLHLIGHLQTNKVKEAVGLFDVIQTLDSFKLAEKLVAEEKKQNKNLDYYIEVNIGKEPQKEGVWPEDFSNFINKINDYYPLRIRGIMCIPPIDKNPTFYFQQMKALAESFKLPVVSMGMSEDYKLAVQCGSTMVRIGRALF